MGQGSAGLGAQASLDPPLSAFGARGKKAQRIAAAHDPHLSLQPPERALRPRAAALPSLGTRVLVYCEGGGVGSSGAQGGSPRGRSGQAGRWGRGPPTWRGTGYAGPGRSALLGPFCHPQASPRAATGAFGSKSGRIPPLAGATPLCRAPQAIALVTGGLEGREAGSPRGKERRRSPEAARDAGDR